MAGPYNVYFKLSNGQVISGYIAASAAVGTYLPVDTSGNAASTSPDTFYTGSTVVVTDIWTTCASGMFEIIAKGQPTNVFVDCAAQQASAANRPAPNFGLTAGTPYMLKVTVQCAA